MGDGAGSRDPGKLGMILLLTSLSMLFGATITAYLVVRSRATGGWPPAGSPGFPPGLWLSTLLILALSFAIESGLRGIRAGNERRLAAASSIALVLAVAFLMSQALAWRVILEARANLYGFTFFMLIGLHAAHVIGGLVPLGIVAARARRGGRYRRESHAGVLYTTMYWHFLAVVWIVMFVLMFLLTRKVQES
jgi:cytochrome c oxidase subunit III